MKTPTIIRWEGHAAGSDLRGQLDGLRSDLRRLEYHGTEPGEQARLRPLIEELEKAVEHNKSVRSAYLATEFENDLEREDWVKQHPVYSLDYKTRALVGLAVPK